MTRYFKTPIGWLELSASENGLKSIHYCKTPPTEKPFGKEDPIIKQTCKQLAEYFEGDREEFTVPLNPDGTAFQKRVWSLLQEIPYGHTATYGELAHKLGDANKVRAVGTANGDNPIPILIPCHRVVGAGNGLVGYSGGIERKRFLLKHEGVLLL